MLLSDTKVIVPPNQDEYFQFKYYDAFYLLVYKENKVDNVLFCDIHRYFVKLRLFERSSTGFNDYLHEQVVLFFTEKWRDHFFNDLNDPDSCVDIIESEFLNIYK